MVDEDRIRIDELIHRYGMAGACDSCQYRYEWTEAHPYGDTSAQETLADCSCKSDDECPRLDDA